MVVAVWVSCQVVKHISQWWLTVEHVHMDLVVAAVKACGFFACGVPCEQHEVDHHVITRPDPGLAAPGADYPGDGFLNSIVSDICPPAHGVHTSWARPGQHKTPPPGQ